MTTTHLLSIKRIIFPLVLVFTVLSYLTSATLSPAASPAAETELICHTDNPAECYPKLFSATEEFQVVHDDQGLPPGLHVQLDVQTGQKKAKLYNPSEENPALAGLPVDQDVIVVDPEPRPDQESKIPPGAPAYEPLGKVKAPREKNEDFSQALQIVKESFGRQQPIKNSVLHEALQLLDDLSHDLYYGLQIAEDAEAVQSLFCLLLRGEEAEAQEGPFTERADFMASSVLSATIGNNARALATIEGAWGSISSKHCEASSYPINQELFIHLAPTSEPNTKLESEEAGNIRLYLPVVSGLLKSPEIRTEFLNDDGMRSLLQILLREGPVWESRRAKAAQIVSDTFLDEDFGATLGLWPRKQQTDAAKCTTKGPRSLDEECWAYHLDKISQAAGAPEWSKQLLSLLQQAQMPSSSSEAPRKHTEL
ncbi:hypothetical protein F5B22DRAFT_576268 [Xylaria bambusicola]|uniref:uncharacterized protein n=1 Tax=Xylaria bambusicola TaxID=326684 RepID=UPI002007AC69|nr:uncharacterized protein F5B22DRAFT_576268 [Xylaria bambusicola]KAI0503059.1 hypothetical protein F5B22DRAFT_576268 [Xylaria bambusicola]